jgi:hypothetical protein
MLLAVGGWTTRGSASPGRRRGWRGSSSGNPPVVASRNQLPVSPCLGFISQTTGFAGAGILGDGKHCADGDAERRQGRQTCSRPLTSPRALDEETNGSTLWTTTRREGSVRNIKATRAVTVAVSVDTSPRCPFSRELHFPVPPCWKPKVEKSSFQGQLQAGLESSTRHEQGSTSIDQPPRRPLLRCRTARVARLAPIANPMTSLAGPVQAGRLLRHASSPCPRPRCTAGTRKRSEAGNGCEDGEHWRALKPQENNPNATNTARK